MSAEDLTPQLAEDFEYEEADLDENLGDERTAEEIEAILQPEYVGRVIANEEKDGRPANNPDIVRTSFINYLRSSFPYGKHWEHPSGVVFTHALIKEKLEKYKMLNRGNYKALWCLWTTQQTRAFIAENFNFSGSSIKRRWNRAIDTLLVMLLFPELEPQTPVNLYVNRM